MVISMVPVTEGGRGNSCPHISSDSPNSQVLQEADGGKPWCLLPLEELRVHFVLLDQSTMEWVIERLEARGILGTGAIHHRCW